MPRSSLNTRAAGILRECAHLLEQQNANRFRINAYIRAAEVLESLPRDAGALLRKLGRGPRWVPDSVAGVPLLLAVDREYDWFVIYFNRDDHEEGQQTVVTETEGPLEGMRVVRGREAECLQQA